MEQYVDAMLREATIRKNEISKETINTIYLGGGTPSVMPVELISNLVNGLHKTFNLDHLSEFTFEVNPDDITTAYITALREIGINRVSMGVQSFNDEELQTINRRHTARQAINAVKTIKNSDISNISIDLIYGLPGQSLESWQDNVEKAISLDIQHISAYCLSYEPGTRLWVMRERGKVQETSDELCVTMHNSLSSMLKKAGFEHYEISNFAKPGYRSQHNSNYWNFTPYLGIGAAAHSYDGTTRRHNPANIKLYIESLNQGKAPYEEEHLEWWERHDEEVMVRLRTSDGLEINTFRTKYGNKVTETLVEKANQFIQQGLLELNNSTLSLTQKGVMMSDNIIRELMWD